ncbi:transcription factor GTE1-like isoform X4 [Malus sylvestris]|uniref:transcription factor GTE1 isoform X2 n=1 Tax=Malus domestica TaxID=3750 RepID=UPI0004990AC4|nr:transcription factor GTE1 isoform X4 [Malus domestica]XP_050106550.1 transcription factor GTE1-like isoform X4 [Malus sylvestris]
MEPASSSNPDFTSVDGAAVVEGFDHSVDEISAKVDTLEKRVNEVERFYLTTGNPHLPTSKGVAVVKDKQLTASKKQQQDASRREAAATKRMQELMRQFSAMFRQVIEKPMDLGTIKNRMEAKDGSEYKNVREIYADVRLVFKNAMKYNDEGEDVYVMAQSLLQKFEEKWLKLLPKVVEEETRRADEEAEARRNMQLSQDAAYASTAKDLSNELFEIDVYLRNLRQTVVQKCRKMSSDDKRKLGTALSQLSAEDLSKALEIVAQSNPNFQATAQEVDLDIDAQNECTLWRLKVFVKEALKVQGKSPEAIGGKVQGKISEAIGGNKVAGSKRNREICDTLAKTAVRRTKKISNM